MKVYWASKPGVVITSANLSTNALGAGDLKEFGVLLPATSIDIDEVIKTLKLRPFSREEMDRLERDHRKLMAGKLHLASDGFRAYVAILVAPSQVIPSASRRAREF
jgi:hypothetical protein